MIKSLLGFTLIVYSCIINGQKSDQLFKVELQTTLDSILFQNPKNFQTVFEDRAVTIHLFHPKKHDNQIPHPKDEFYIVASGKGKYAIQSDTFEVSRGDLVFAPKYVKHNFYDFSDDFSAWVIFYDNITNNFDETNLHRHLIDDFVDTWQRTKDYTLDILELMPEKLFRTRLEEDSRSFAEEALHIADNLYFLSTNYILETGRSNFTLEYSTKADIIDALDEAFDFFLNSVMTLNETNALNSRILFYDETYYSKQQILYLAKDHTAHHRSKMLVILNSLDIKPPDYVGW